ncbi:TIGR03013 family XrtA/PEP-CTERM system glycosyltransferase [Azohydromonas lata]|uniref:TIGR03013 family XrtA/PEP-CTERM system glycosyltransferase n=1 Tax=Azohydromonas lata TaxID=45677 RepID=A0ABU5IKG7_9BURK|nr:TIGR03013 family XrtA/PEP-CTERM system glycosyltransferase [Azohydromonas lata]MDZ5459388.1 TIGR03013 family XrtA/PEP-CTERM system glycosyltransferase [Azohydromonas lata]
MLYQVGFDFAALTLVVVLFGMSQASEALVLTMPGMAAQGMSLAAFLCVIATASGFYEPAHKRSLGQSCVRALVCVLLVLPLAFLIAHLMPNSLVPAAALPTAALLGTAVVVAHRVYAAHALWPARLRTRVLVLGAGERAANVGRTIKEAEASVELVGYYPTVNEGALGVPAQQLLSTHEPLAQLAQRLKVHEVIVAPSERRGGGMPMDQLLACRTQGIRVLDVSSHFEKTLGQLRVDCLEPALLVFGTGFNQGRLRMGVKRLCDLLSAALLLLVSAPVMLITALLIKLESPGPVLYKQERVGLNGRCFDVIKFRSMRTDAEKDGRPRWATAKDDRVTRIGRIIRRLRIDELPQIFNILLGDMSIVGPRPERPFFVEQLARELPYYGLRHSIKPGVTGWAQVRYPYGATVEDSLQKLQYDLYYVKNHTLTLDLLVLFETVGVVLTGKGAR